MARRGRERQREGFHRCEGGAYIEKGQGTRGEGGGGWGGGYDSTEIIDTFTLFTIANDGECDGLIEGS